MLYVIRLSMNVFVPQTDKGFLCHRDSGFGFCPETNQYKVLRLLYPSLGFGSLKLIQYEAEINTVGTNLWRRVGDAPCNLQLYWGGCFLHGALHWIVHDPENCFKSMCCFDFGKEQFQPFPGSSQFRGLPGQMKLGVLKDGLSLCHRLSDYMLDIWAMKYYAVQDSWTKDFAIKFTWVPYQGLHSQPLMILNNGDILLLFDSSLIVSYNMRYRSCRMVRFNGSPSSSRVLTYIPSLVSIKNAATGRYS